MFFFIIILYSINASGATEKYGVITKNERWTVENSPYIISDDLLVTRNARIVITPGVQVYIGKPVEYNPEIQQLNNSDSFTVSIQIEGGFKCVGRGDNRISIIAESPNTKQNHWYGIVLNSDREDDIEIAFTDIAHACNAITIKKGSPPIRNCIIEFNNVGVLCTGESKPILLNNIITYNGTAGIRIDRANPKLYSNIVTFNHVNGIWSDNISNITLKYNCIFGNSDANLSGCDPEYGIVKRKNKNKDSTDFAHNLYIDPVFAGSSADSMAVEMDLSIQTDKYRIKDTTIAKILHNTLTDSSAIKHISKKYKRYMLSEKYSPCINSGKTGKDFQDYDGTRNDMGIYGGQEFIDLSKK